MKEYKYLLNIFSFRISFIKVFSFNLNTLTIRLERSINFSLDRRFFSIFFYFKL